MCYTALISGSPIRFIAQICFNVEAFYETGLEREKTASGNGCRKIDFVVASNPGLCDRIAISCGCFAVESALILFDRRIFSEFSFFTEYDSGFVYFAEPSSFY